jgi:hypothetical protein
MKQDIPKAEECMTGFVGKLEDEKVTISPIKTEPVKVEMHLSVRH